MEDIRRIDNQNLGNAGEYYLASYLSAKDCVVTVKLGRNEGYGKVKYSIIMLKNP